MNAHGGVRGAVTPRLGRLAAEGLRLNAARSSSGFVLAAIIAPDYPDYPATAQEIRELNAATRRAMLASLDTAVLEGKRTQQPEQNRQEEDVANAGLTLYQSRTRSAGARYRLSPGFRSNAA